MTSPRTRNQSNSRQFRSLFNEDWHWTALFSALLAVSISLFVFVRFLDFYLTPTMDKVVVFGVLFLFFFSLFLFFLTPIFNGLVKRPKRGGIILIASLVLTAALYFLLPAQTFIIRTVHTLQITVSAESQPIIIENLTDPSQSVVPWHDVTTDGVINADAVTLNPGESLEYTRQMTGGVSFMVSAREGASRAMIQWDDSEQSLELSQNESLTLETDPTSVGSLPRLEKIIFQTIKLNEWLLLFLGLSLVLGAGYLFSMQDGYHYAVYQQKAQRYLLDYLLIAGLTLLIAIGLRVFRPESMTVHLVILLPALVYLVLKLIYFVVPSLPLMLLCLTVGVNILAHWVWFDPDLLPVRSLAEQTFNELTKLVNPGDATFMSVGFYKPLRGSELIVPAGSFLADEVNVARLERINLHESIEVRDYSGEVSAEVFNQLIQNDGWVEWPRRVSGAYYFYKPELPVTAPIVVFSFGDNFLLIPENFLDELGLNDVSVLD